MQEEFMRAGYKNFYFHMQLWASLAKEGKIDRRLAQYTYLRHDPAFRFRFGFLISSSKWEDEINKQRKTIDV